MSQQPALGQRVRIREGVEKYGGLCGQIIHRQWVTGSGVYHREGPGVRAGQGQLALVIALEDPPPGLEPVILCYEEHISLILDE